MNCPIERPGAPGARSTSTSLFAALVLVLWCIATARTAHAQVDDEMPTLGLVLSGGGAKGLCHIGVLKVLEEEGIRPDLITGTSMGSLVGGLYACGYSAADIERIVTDIRWPELLTNRIGLDKIAFEEKRYYGRWLAELPYDHGPRLPSGLIRGQHIMTLLRRNTLPFHTAQEFGELPIPFACIATDMARGEAVVQRSGFLPDAMRASMSIPTFFSPILLDSLLLVDGGEIRNFPVSDAREMGADLVIGVEVSEGLLSYEALDDPVDILTQSAMFTSLKDNDRQRGLCDVLIVPDYAPYSTGSFVDEAVPYLIRKGYEAADTLRPALRELALRAKMDRRYVEPPGVVIPDSLRVDKLEVTSKDERVNALVTPRIGSIDGRIAVPELEERIDLLYGTRRFDLVQYRVALQDQDSILMIETQASAPGRIGMSLNYDLYHQVSLGLLFVLNDKLLRSSRLAVEAFAGRYPQVEADYLKYFGPRRRMALEMAAYYESGPSFIRDGNAGKQAELRQDIVGGFLRLRTTSSRAFSTGLEFHPRRLSQTPKVSAIISIGDGPDAPQIDLRDIDRVTASWNAVGLFGQWNTMDQYVYPSRGWQVDLSAAQYLNAVTSLRYEQEYLDELDPAISEVIVALTEDLTEYDEYARVIIEWQGRVPISSRGSIMLDGAATMADRTDLSGGDLVTMGGMRRPDRRSFAFWGLNEYDGEAVDLVMARGGFQWRFGKDLFWQVAANNLWTGFRDDDPSTVLEQQQVLGYGTTLGLRGPWGVLQVGAAGNDANHDTQFWFNFGYRL